MSLWDSLKAVTRGENPIDYLYLEPGTVEASDAADRGLDELNRQRLEDNKISSEEFERRRGVLTSWAFPTTDLGQGAGRLFEQPGASPAEGFREGLAEGANNIRKTISSGINGVLGTSLRIIPWQIWLGLAIYGFIILWPYLPRPGKK
jgi:hypothetical protein